MLRKFLFLTAALTLVISLLGCAPQAAPASLKIAVLPILDGLPLYVAEQEGLFKKENLSVELVPVGSGPERDQLIASGQADGMINEMVSVLFFNKEQVKVQVVRYARAASSGAALFSILAGKDSGLQSLADLKGQPLGISDGTVIAYLTERMLAAEGLAPSDLKTVSVPKLDARLALLNSGELKAAVLPEPLATLAVQQGARVLLADTAYPEYSFSTLTFRKAVLDQNPAAVKAFLRAVEAAVVKINQNPSQYTQTLVDHKLLAQPLVGKFQVPQFVTAGVPSEKQFADALAWAKEKKYVSQDISYADCVSGVYLP